VKHVTIIGGGITGLAAAFYLQEKSRARGLALDYALVEAEPRLGGKIVTEHTGGFVVEGGPDSFITQKPDGLLICRDLGLSEGLIPCREEGQKVYVLQQGRLCALPEGFRLAVPSRFRPFLTSPLVSWPGKARMLMDLAIPARRDDGDESVADFVRRRLGQEAVEKFAGPLMGGIYVADPERLSMRSTFPLFIEMEQKHRSLILAMLAARRARRRSGRQAPAMFMSPRDGMQQITDAIRARLTGELRTGERVTALRLRPSSSTHQAHWDIQTSAPGRPPLSSRAVILALPAPAAADLLEPLAPKLASQLRAIRYVSTATVSLAYRTPAIPAQRPLDGFGFVVPKREGRRIIACTWSSTKFEHRAPPGGALIRVFVGGEGAEHLVDLPDDELVALARQEIRDLMRWDAVPDATRVYRWPQGNPQYDVGHLNRVAEMEEMASHRPGLFLAGSAYRGIGIPDCVRSAQRAVDGILGELQDDEAADG
jgi:protoporphyrinogen/coproporphyrinogen III oxidase